MRGGAFFNGKEGRDDFRKNSFFNAKEGRVGFRKEYYDVTNQRYSIRLPRRIYPCEGNRAFASRQRTTVK